MKANIDKFLSNLSSNSRDNLNPKKLKNYIKKYVRLNKSKRLYIILPGWHESVWLNNKLKNRILRKGYSYLGYSFKPEILSTNWKLTERTFKDLGGKISLEIKKHGKKFPEIILVGISLNSVSATMIANIRMEVSKLVLVSPGHSLSESLWYGIRTKKIKEEFIRNGISLRELNGFWRDLAPENNINNLGCKEILVYLSKADKIVPYWCGKKLANKMRKKKLNLKVIENKYLGHYLTIVKFCLFDKEIFE